MDMSCTHPVQIAGLCAVCGQLLESDEHNAGALAAVHDNVGIRISADEARRLDRESTQRLVSQRKLALIVDLDQTIIHATVDPTVGEWMRDVDNPNFQALSGVGRFRLGLDGKAILDVDRQEQQHKEEQGDKAGTATGGARARHGSQDGGEAGEKDGQAKAGREDGQARPGAGAGSGATQTPAAATANDAEGCWYYVKPRPGLAEFLAQLSTRFELHVYTMGTRSYAECVCRLVDPRGEYFGSRILSRDENGSLMQKSLKRIFPNDTSMVVIIDDRADVWRWSPNLVKVVPYDFFVGSGDINASFLPAAPSVPAPSTSAEAAAEEEDDEATSTSRSPTPSLSRRPSSNAAPSMATTVGSGGGEAGVAAAGPQPEGAAAGEAAAAKEMADQSQKDALHEQLDSRPLQKMQEALDEKLAVAVGTSSRRASTAGETPDTEGSPEASGASASGTASSSSSASQVQKAAATADGGLPPVTPGSASSPSAGAPPLVPPRQDGLEEANSASAPTQTHAVLRDDDTELQRIQRILDDIHRKWYERFDEGPNATSGREALGGIESEGEPLDKPRVVDIIAELKASILAGCNIVFSSIVPLNHDPQTSDLWRLAVEFGASCSRAMTNGITTHVVAAKPGTAKANVGFKRGLHVVWPDWLNASAAMWSRQPEMWYSLPQPSEGALRHVRDEDEEEGGASAVAGAAPDDDARTDERTEAGPDADVDGIADAGAADVTALASTSNGGMGVGALANMNWSDADDEVNAFLEDDSEEDGDGGDGDEAGDEADEGSDVQDSEARRSARAGVGDPSRSGVDVQGAGRRTLPRSKRPRPSSSDGRAAERGQGASGDDEDGERSSNGSAPTSGDEATAEEAPSRREATTHKRRRRGAPGASRLRNELGKRVSADGDGSGGEADDRKDTLGSTAAASKATAAPGAAEAASGERAPARRGGGSGGGGGSKSNSHAATATAAAAADAAGWDTDGSQADFLTALAEEMEMQLGDDDGG